MNTQLDLKFYEEEKFDTKRKVKYGDMFLIEQRKFVKKKSHKVMTLVKIVTDKEYAETSIDWRLKCFKSETENLPIERLKDINYKIRAYNRYIESNKVKWLQSPKPILLTKAKKTNTNIGDEIVKVVKNKTIYKLVSVIYDGKIKLTDFFKKDLDN